MYTCTVIPHVKLLHTFLSVLLVTLNVMVSVQNSISLKKQCILCSKSGVGEPTRDSDSRWISTVCSQEERDNNILV